MNPSVCGCPLRSFVKMKLRQVSAKNFNIEAVGFGQRGLMAVSKVPSLTPPEFHTFQLRVGTSFRIFELEKKSRSLCYPVLGLAKSVIMLC